MRDLHAIAIILVILNGGNHPVKAFLLVGQRQQRFDASHDGVLHDLQWRASRKSLEGSSRLPLVALAAINLNDPLTKTTTTTTRHDGALQLRDQARQLKLEAADLELTLTRNKIAAIELKLRQEQWVKKHPEENVRLRGELEILCRKLGESVPPPPLMSFILDEMVPSNAPPTTNVEAVSLTAIDAQQRDDNIRGSEDAAVLAAESITRSIDSSDDEHRLYGFTEEELELYLPVAGQIESSMPDATMEAKLDAFRQSPALQSHIEASIGDLMGTTTITTTSPLESLMEQMDDLRSKYLSATSRNVQLQLKREINQLEQSIKDNDGPFDAFDEEDMPSPLSDDEWQQNVEALAALPPVLQGLYMKQARIADYGNSNNSNNLALAVLLYHYEEPLHWLELVKFIDPLPDTFSADATRCLESMPDAVRNHLARTLGLEPTNATATTVEALVAKLMTADEDDSSSSNNQWTAFQEGLLASAGQYDWPEHDIEYVDRSRFLDVTYPSIGRLESVRPTQEQMDSFLRTVIDPKTFMVTTKPEPVEGGYYMRGHNLLDEDTYGVRLVECLLSRLEGSDLKSKVDFYYMPDPSPLSDEQVEMGCDDEKIILVTGKNPAVMLAHADPLIKATVSMLGLASVAIFALATIELQPHLKERLDAALLTENANLDWMTGVVMPVGLSMLVIQLVHETAHWLVAMRDGMQIGIPTPIPSLQLGIMGAITPLKSSPPSMKSLFDFAIAGPLFGSLASIAFLLHGLVLTRALEMSGSVDLPALPHFLLRSSALGGGLIELALGRGALSSSITDNAVLSLHPFAIAGYVGLLSNALALLPIGCTDGGRIALAMFGRRGAWTVVSCTTILLCIAGLFGLDDSRIMGMYVIFALVWQRDFEIPARNEVEELDFGRGLLAIGTTLFVALVLLPM